METSTRNYQTTVGDARGKFIDQDNQPFRNQQNRIQDKDNRPMQQQPDSSLPVGRRITQGDARTLDRTPHRKGFKPETIRVLKVAASALTASFFTTVGVELAFAGDEWGGLALALAGVTAGTVGGFFIGEVQEEPLPEVDAGLPEVDDSWLEAFYDREMTL